MEGSELALGKSGRGVGDRYTIICVGSLLPPLGALLGAAGGSGEDGQLVLQPAASQEEEEEEGEEEQVSLSHHGV